MTYHIAPRSARTRARAGHTCAPRRARGLRPRGRCSQCVMHCCGLCIQARPSPLRVRRAGAPVPAPAAPLQAGHGFGTDGQQHSGSAYVRRVRGSQRRLSCPHRLTRRAEPASRTRRYAAPVPKSSANSTEARARARTRTQARARAPPAAAPRQAHRRMTRLAPRPDSARMPADGALVAGAPVPCRRRRGRGRRGEGAWRPRGRASATCGRRKRARGAEPLRGEERERAERRARGHCAGGGWSGARGPGGRGGESRDSPFFGPFYQTKRAPPRQPGRRAARDRGQSLNACSARAPSGGGGFWWRRCCEKARKVTDDLMGLRHL